MTVQLCILHMVRYSLNYVTWKYCKDVASDLKSIYGAGTIERAAQALDDFEEPWGKSYPSIGQS
jgi:putative transposase